MANETIADVCAEMKSQNECYACRTFADRILAAHNREMAAKDEMARITAQSAQARFDEEMAAKDAEIARLKAGRRCGMKYIDGFDTANARATTPDGYKLVAHYSTGTKFTAFTMKVGCGAACIRAYDEHGGISDWWIPVSCRKRSRGENDSARDGETGDGNVL